MYTIKQAKPELQYIYNLGYCGVRKYCSDCPFVTRDNMYIVLCKSQTDTSVNKIKGAQFVVPSQNTMLPGYQTLATIEYRGQMLSVPVTEH